MKIESKRHTYKFYLTLSFSTIFLLGLGTVLLWIFYKEINVGEIKTKLYFLPLASIAIYAFTVYTIIRYNKNAPKIIIDKNTIMIDGEKFNWSEINEIKLTGKYIFPYLPSIQMEGFTLKLNNGKTKTMYDDMYSNSWELKSFIKNSILEKKDTQIKVSKLINKSEILLENFEIFKGNQFTSLRGISLWGVFIFFIFYLPTREFTPNTKAIIFLSLIGIFWFTLHSFMMNYFECSRNFFVIKNHNFLWKKKIYRLSMINEIVFESQGKQPNCLRIITHDFQNKLFFAATLRDSDWLELKKTLERNEIKVRNECIIEE